MAVSDKIVETICPSCNSPCHVSVVYIGKKITCEKCTHSFETVKFNPASLLHNFCKIAIKNDLISEEKFDEIFSEHKAVRKLGDTFSLEDAFIDKGLITTEQKNRLMLASVRKLNKKFVNLAVEKSLIQREEGEIALLQQAEDFRNDKLTLICDILIESGIINHEDRESLLFEIQNRKSKIDKEVIKATRDKAFNYPFMGIVALKKEIISKSELERALKIQKKEEMDGIQNSFEDILFEANIISKEMKDKLILKTLKRLDKKLGKIAIRHGFVTKEELKKAATRQASSFKKYDYKPLFDILIKDEEITEKEFDLVFSEFKGLERKQAGELVKKGQIILSRIASERDSIKKDQSDSDDAIKKVNKEDHSKIPAKKDQVKPSEANGNEEPARDEEPEISLSFSGDSQKAYITLSSALGDDIEDSLNDWVKDIKKMVEDSDIIFGVISDDLIEACVKLSILKRRPFKVAVGDPPKEGKEAEIIYHFDTDYLKAGVVTDGMIDFRDRGDIPYITKGDLLTELIPAEPGKNGYDIFGNVIEIPEIKEVELKCGNGTILSEDSLKIFADVDGRPDLAINGQISVFPEMTIKGDVNFETGNVDFKGNITVQGTICEGFKVKGVNVTTKNINGGDVEVTGDIDVSGGIVDSNIKADGYVQAMYIKGATLDIYGDLLIVKEIIDSYVKLSGMCRSERCKIINSSISAKLGVEVGQIGTDVSIPCKIRVGVSDHIDAIVETKKVVLDQLKLRLEKTQDQMEAYLEKLRDEHQKIIETSMYQDSLDAGIDQLKEIIEKTEPTEDAEEKSMIETEIQEKNNLLKESDEKIKGFFNQHDKLLDAVLAGMVSIELIIHKIVTLNEDVVALNEKRDKVEGKAFVKVKNQIYAKTMLFGKKSSLILQEDLKNVNISEMWITDPKNKIPPKWSMEVKKFK